MDMVVSMAKSHLMAEVERLQNKIRNEIQYHQDEIAILEKLLGGGSEVGNGRIATVRRGRPPKTRGARKTSRKGGRRSREEIEAEAAEVVKLIKGAGSGGISASDILAKYPSIFPSVKQYLLKYAKGSGIKAVGKKQFTKYVAG